MAEKKTEEKNEERFQLVELPTETGLFIKDSVEDKVLDDKYVLVRILNKLEQIDSKV